MNEYVRIVLTMLITFMHACGWKLLKARERERESTCAGACACACACVCVCARARACACLRPCAKLIWRSWVDLRCRRCADIMRGQSVPNMFGHSALTVCHRSESVLVGPVQEHYGIQRITHHAQTVVSSGHIIHGAWLSEDCFLHGRLLETCSQRCGAAAELRGPQVS